MTADSLRSKGINPNVIVSIGDVDVSRWITNIRTRIAVGEMSSALLLLDGRALDDVFVDYSGTVKVDFMSGGASVRRFTGLVERVDVRESGINILCRSGQEMVDSAVTMFIHKSVPVPEVIWTIARHAGIREDRLLIDGVENLPEEQLEVLIPIVGLDLDTEISMGAIDIVPPSAVKWISETAWPTGGPGQVGNPETVVRSFLEARAFMRGRYTDAKLFDAEQVARRDAELICAWISMRLRFAAARLPDGRPQRFDRLTAKAAPLPVPVAAVRSLQSERRWVRITANVQRLIQAALPLSPEGTLDPPIPSTISQRDSEAVLAFWRAQSIASPLGSVIALWDAIEFYVGGIRVPLIFTDAELAHLRDEAPSWLIDSKRERYLNLIAGLNNVPLFTRLLAAIKSDGVPVSEEEIAVLSRLRRVRNPAQHGRDRKMPDEDDLRRAWSIVARLLLFRLGRRPRGAAAPHGRLNGDDPS